MEVSPSGKALDSDSSMRRFKSFYLCQYVDMAELADALDSGSSEWKLVQVQVLLSTPLVLLFVSFRTLKSVTHFLGDFITEPALLFF